MTDESEIHDRPKSLTDKYGDVPLGVECAWLPGAPIERESSENEEQEHP